MIRIQSLSKSFGKNEVLKDINLDINHGAVSGIVGINGAGKTTLFSCIAGYLSFNGDIINEGKPIPNHLAYLSTEPFFMSRITGVEYLQMFANARNCQHVKISEKNIFDLPLDRYVDYYSTGMQKKLALTAILLTPYDYYILDEPFNGVDIQSNLLITEIIHHLKYLGKTILISSHIYSTLSTVCDRIHLIENGRIQKSVSKEEFDQLESEMKQYSIGDKIERLGLT